MTGICGALVTSAYCLYIVLEGRRVIRSYRAMATAQLACISEVKWRGSRSNVYWISDRAIPQRLAATDWY